jgi:hypothetical protein
MTAKEAATIIVAPDYKWAGDCPLAIEFVRKMEVCYECMLSGRWFTVDWANEGLVANLREKYDLPTIK